MDSIGLPNQVGEQTKMAKNVLTRRLINIILKNKEKIIDQWIEEMSHSPSTLEYHNFEKHNLHPICDKIISQLILWLAGPCEVERIKRFYTKLGGERRMGNFKISGVLSALSLIRKHIWDIALRQEDWQKRADLYMTFELQRRMTIYFDLATFYMTRGFEKK
jgi:hypothetical protein